MLFYRDGCCIAWLITIPYRYITVQSGFFYVVHVEQEIPLSAVLQNVGKLGQQYLVVFENCEMSHFEIITCTRENPVKIPSAGRRRQTI